MMIQVPEELKMENLWSKQDIRDFAIGISSGIIGLLCMSVGYAGLAFLCGTLCGKHLGALMTRESPHA